MNFIRVVYKSRQPAKITSFSARFCRLLSLLHGSRYRGDDVYQVPQPSTFHKSPATYKLKENLESLDGNN